MPVYEKSLGLSVEQLKDRRKDELPRAYCDSQISYAQTQFALQY